MLASAAVIEYVSVTEPSPSSVLLTVGVTVMVAGAPVTVATSPVKATSLKFLSVICPVSARPGVSCGVRLAGEALIPTILNEACTVSVVTPGWSAAT